MRQCELVEITKLQCVSLEKMFNEFHIKEIIPRLNVIVLEGKEVNIYPIDIMPNDNHEFGDILYNLGYDFIKTGMIPMAATLVVSTDKGIIVLGRTIRGYITKATARTERYDYVRLTDKFRLSKCHKECVLGRFFAGYLESRRDVMSQYN